MCRQSLHFHDPPATGLRVNLYDALNPKYPQQLAEQQHALKLLGNGTAAQQEGMLKAQQVAGFLDSRPKPTPRRILQQVRSHVSMKTAASDPSASQPVPSQNSTGEQVNHKRHSIHSVFYAFVTETATSIANRHAPQAAGWVAAETCVYVFEKCVLAGSGWRWTLHRPPNCSRLFLLRS